MAYLEKIIYMDISYGDFTSLPGSTARTDHLVKVIKGLSGSISNVIDNYFISRNLSGIKRTTSEYVTKGQSSYYHWCGGVQFIFQFRTKEGYGTSIGGGVNTPCGLNYTFDYNPDYGGGTIPGTDKPFEPPTPINPTGDDGDFPFFDKILGRGTDISSLDDLSEEKYNYLKEKNQDNEVGIFSHLFDKAVDWIDEKADYAADLIINYDSENSEIVDFYNDNNLDTNEDYQFKFSDNYLGYNDNGTLKKIFQEPTLNANGFVSPSSASYFLSPAMIATGTVLSGVPLGTIATVGTAAVTAYSLYNLVDSGALDDPLKEGWEKTKGAYKKGMNYITEYASKIQNGFTNTGDRIKDLNNTDLMTQAEQNDLGYLLPTGGTMADGKISIDTDDIDFPKIKFDTDWTFPTVTFPSIPDIGVLVPDIPNIGVDSPSIPNIKVDAPTIPDIKINVPTIPDIGISAPTIPNIKVNVPTIPDIGVSAPTMPDIKVNIPTIPDIGVSVPTMPDIKVNVPTIPDIGINVGDNVLPLDVTDETLKLDGFGTDWLALLKLLLTQFKHKNSLAVNEKTELQNKIDAHVLEYLDGGIRIKEGSVAGYNEKVFTTTVKQGLEDIDGVGRIVKSWLSKYSSNVKNQFIDSTGETVEIKEGYYANQDSKIKANHELNHRTFGKNEGDIYIAKYLIDLEDDVNEVSKEVEKIEIIKSNLPSELTDYQIVEDVAIKFFDNTDIQNIDNDLDLFN